MIRSGIFFITTSAKFNSLGRLLAIAVSLALLFSCDKIPQQPNVLLIITDDQGWGDAGFQGNGIVETPNLDSLANHSVRFNRFYVSPVCAPTRASLLTGKYHLSTGVSWVTHRKEVMRKEEITIAEILGGNGYKTGLFGKWHNGKQYPHDPIGQGFQRFFGFADGHLNNYFDSPLIDQFEQVNTKGYVADVLTKEAIAFMQGDEPFFCYLSLNTPHSPFQVPDAYFDKYKSKGLDDKLACIYGMIENIDSNVGQIIASLDKTNMLDNTMIIFMSDNGPNGERYNGGFKGIKSHVDEGGVRVPLLISYPAKKWNDGRTIDHMAAHIDLLPTIVSQCLPDFKIDHEIDGLDMGPLIDENISKRQEFYTHQVTRVFDTIPGAIRTKDYLLTLKPGDTSLFNLSKDPFQETDLYLTEAKTGKDLLSKYSTWFNKVTKQGLQPSPVESGHQDIPQVEFPAQEISAGFFVNFKGKAGWANDYLTHFSDSSSVTWNTFAVAQSTYNVWAQLAVDSSEMASLTLQVDSVDYTIALNTPLLKRKIHSPDRVKRGEVYAYEWPEVQMATITLEPGKHIIKLKPKNVKNLELKSLKLKLKNND